MATEPITSRNSESISSEGALSPLLVQDFIVGRLGRR
jgi:hypothetical protein